MTRALLLIAGLLALAGCSIPITGAATPAEPAQSVTVQAGPIAATSILRPVKVEIPAIGVTDDIVPVGLAPDRTMQIPPVDQVGWYKLGVAVGAQGAAVLAGHVNFNGVAGSFSRLDELKVGDQVTVTGEDDGALTFEVYETRQFAKAAFDYQFVFGDRDSSDLVLVTCSGRVVNHSYTDNTAVAARLVQP